MYLLSNRRLVVYQCWIETVIFCMYPTFYSLAMNIIGWHSLMGTMYCHVFAILKSYSHLQQYLVISRLTTLASNETFVMSIGRETSYLSLL